MLDAMAESAPHVFLKNGTVLKREDYAKLSDAQEKILEQFELIQKIILKNKGG